LRGVPVSCGAESIGIGAGFNAVDVEGESVNDRGRSNDLTLLTKRDRSELARILHSPHVNPDAIGTDDAQQVLLDVPADLLIQAC